MGSVEVHGDWNDLYRNHLTLEGLQFSPNMNGLHVRPQSPLTLVMLSLTVILDNIEFLIPEKAAIQALQSPLEDLLRRASKVDDLHERFLGA
jgi:hypothetical protein